MIYHIKANIKQLINLIVNDLYNIEGDIFIERPKSIEMGDVAIPVFSLAKQLKISPNVIANEIANKLNDSTIDKVEVVGGYINVFLDKAFYTKLLVETVLEEKSNYGSGNNNDKKVIVEYSSPNIAKPFHIGHIRTTLIGAALYRVFQKAGYDTVGINHLGDYGTQFGKLIVAIKMWGDKEVISQNPISELLKLYIQFHEVAEQNPSLEDEAREWFTKLENNNQEALDLWEWIREISLIEFDRVYDMFNIKFDSLAGESFYSDKMDKVVQRLNEKGILVYEDGAGVIKLEEYGLPNVLVTKKDGSTLYITRDLAAAIYRMEHYGFYKNIYVVGHQQELHFKQLFKILELMGYEWANQCKHVIFGTVSLEDGTLSTRQGRVVFLEDVLKRAISRAKEVLEEKNPSMNNQDIVAKQVGLGAIIFQELFINRKKDYSFSWEKTLSFEGETGPYIQYTGVRIKSLLRQGISENISEIEFKNIPIEMWDIVTTLFNFEEVLNNVIDKYDTSQLAKYVIDIAFAFNRFYANQKIFIDNINQTKLNLAVCRATYIVLEEGLRILGIEIPEEM